jgi:glycosyltransferase involved in cell wall biosynthesis
MDSGCYRILFVLIQPMQPNSGGVQMSTFKLAQQFRKQGHDIGVFSFAKSGHAQFDHGRLWTALEPGGQNEFTNLAELRQVLEEFKPQIVINQMPYEFNIGDVLEKKKDYLLLGCLRNTLFSVKGNLPIYVSRKAPGPLKRLPNNRLVQRMMLSIHEYRHRKQLRKILATYDRFVMFGEPNLQELSHFLPGYDRDSVRLIPNSIPKVEDTVPIKEKRVLWLGRVAREQKQAHLILEVWRRISEQIPDWYLDVVGDGPELDELQRRAKAEGLPRLKFHGRQVPDAFYRRASIFFMTSAFEGFPNTLVEALSYGCVPVIFDSYPVASWIINQGQNGVLVEPGDTDLMSSAILKLTDDLVRLPLAQQALENVRQFQIDRVGLLWQQLFDAELASRNPPKEAEVRP